MKTKKFRNGFEKKIGDELEKKKVKFGYESDKISFVQPEKNRKYTIDFKLPNGIIVETKGRLTVYDRAKMILVRDQHPELDIRFVFQKSSNKIRKGSKTTYADWADKNGFKWAEGTIPDEWLDEQPKSLHS